MGDKTTILVTGVGSYWGAQVAARLLDRASSAVHGRQLTLDDLHVLGVDSVPPSMEIKDLDFIQTDLRNPLLKELFISEQVDMVCHLAFDDDPIPSEGSFDLNVMGTMKLLGACAEAGVKKVVLRSSTAVYGAKPTNPAFITENHALYANHNHGAVRYLAEIETFCSGFRRQVPDMKLTILRFASIIGLTVDTDLTKYLKQPHVPVLLGFNPLMQIIHEKDVVEALVFALINDRPGIYNVAAEGILPLKKLIALAGKPAFPVFHWFAYWGQSLLEGHRGFDPFLPIGLDYIRYPWVADLNRMQDEMGFAPQYTAEEALREFAHQQRLGKYLSIESARKLDEERLRDILERRRRLRERQIISSEDLDEGAIP